MFVTACRYSKRSISEAEYQALTDAPDWQVDPFCRPLNLNNDVVVISWRHDDGDNPNIASRKGVSGSSRTTAGRNISFIRAPCKAKGLTICARATASSSTWARARRSSRRERPAHVDLRVGADRRVDSGARTCGARGHEEVSCPRRESCSPRSSPVFLLTAYSDPDSRATLSAQTAAKVGNPITGEGLPNPAPKVTRNWGELPAGRKWGTSAGLDIDPKDGHIWGYERCGAGTLAGPAAAGHVRDQPRRSRLQVRPPHRQGARELRQGPHGDAAWHPRRPAGQRVDCRLRGQQGRHQGTPGPQVQPEGREAAEPGHRRQAGQRRWPVQPAQRRRRRARWQHLRVRRPRCPGHDHQPRRSPKDSSAAPPRASASSRRTASSSSRGGRSACATASSARRTR